MKKELAEYIHKKLLNEAQNYQWRLVIDSHKNAIEIYFVISIEIEEEQYVQDINARVNDSGQLLFEEVVCFYDETTPKIVADNYLNAVPFDPDTGIEEGYVDAFLKQFNIIAANARAQLRNFMEEESQQEFSLKWNEKNMENTVQTMRETNQYSQNYLTMPRKKKKTLVDQFKEEQDGGVERV